MDPVLAQALKLSVERRLELISLLWDSVVDAHGDDLGLTEAERAELARRRVAHEAEPDAAVHWDEVKARLGIHDAGR